MYVRDIPRGEKLSHEAEVLLNSAEDGATTKSAHASSSFDRDSTVQENLVGNLQPASLPS